MASRKRWRDSGSSAWLVGALSGMLLFGLMPPTARGQDSVTAATTATTDDVTGARRPMPNLDGRAPESPPLSEQLLWIPRVLFSPLYLITEYLLRRPLGALVTEVEQGEVVQTLLDFLTFGPERNVAILPTAFFDFGFSPSVGVYAFWNQFLVPENRISVQGATWGADWLSLTVSDSVSPTPTSKITARVHLERRPDQIFVGIGYDAPERAEDAGIDRSRYTVEQIDASLTGTLQSWRRSEIGYSLGYRSMAFADRGWGDDPNIGALTQALGTSLPEGFRDGYESARLRVWGTLDTRERTVLPVGGARLFGYAEQHVQLAQFPRSAWIRAGGEVLLAAEIAEQRVLGVTAAVAAITPTSDGARVPFTELIDPGNLGPLSGFQQGVLRGMSAATLSLHYTWNIWPLINGQLIWTVGNVFDRYFEDFDVDRTRMTVGLSLQPGLPGGEQLFDMSVAIGTETLERGAAINNVRFTFGTRSWL